MAGTEGGAGIRVEVRGAGEISRALKRLRRRLKDMTPVMDEIGDRLMLSTDRRFETGMDPQGRPWKPSLRARETGGRTLNLSARLRRSITRRASADEVVVGTNVVYAAIHQFGGKTPPRVIRPRTKKALYWPGARHPVRSVRHPGSRMPARPFLGVSGADERAIGRIVDDYLREAV